MIRTRQDLARARRIVIKVGSSLLADAEQGIRLDVVERLANEVSVLRTAGVQVIVVSSGAVALGRVDQGWMQRELSLHEKQAAAAIGQPKLMAAYGEAFARNGLNVAQMLLTKDDLRNRRRYLNACNTSQALLAAGVVPIVNENDTVVVAEIKFGDNDSLGAAVSLVVDADLLVMLTDIDALYDRAPTDRAAKRIDVVPQIQDRHFAMVGETPSQFGTGGMASKLVAARMATQGGVTAAVIDGRTPNRLQSLLGGNDEGTLFLCGVDRQTRRKKWISELLSATGRLQVDAGAADALRRRGSSLLPIGVVSVSGIFDKGECVEIVGPDGEVARGLCNYTAEELRRICGYSSGQIESRLGYCGDASVVHRDNLVIVSDKSTAAESPASK